jgi:hypothetical protein
MLIWSLHTTFELMRLPSQRRTQWTPHLPRLAVFGHTGDAQGSSRTKPVGLFIHRKNSNLVHADTVAVELGLHGSTEHVCTPQMSSDSEENGPLWDHARSHDALLGGTSLQG